MEISAYLCRRNPLHAAGGARLLARAALSSAKATGQARERGKPSEQHQRGWRKATAGPSARPNGAGCSQKQPCPEGQQHNNKSNVIKNDTNMTKLDLNAFGVQELSSKEKMEVIGGAEYLKYTWSGTGNPLIFAFEACANGVKAVANAGIWVYNQLS